MKLAYLVVTVGMLIAAGCIPDSFLNKDDQAEKSGAHARSQPTKPHSFVRPEQVDERNYHEKEKALRQELEMDEQAAAPAKR